MSVDRPAEPKRGRFWPLGLLGALALISAVETWIDRRGDRLMSPDQWIFRTTEKKAPTLAQGRDVLIFGDSMAKLSLAPRRFEMSAGLKAYNFSLSGSQAINSFHMLRKTLDAGAKPRFILVDFHPPLLGASHWHVVENDPYQFRYLETLEIAWRARDATFLGSMLARQLLPSVRGRESIRAVILAQFDGSTPKDWAFHSGVLLRNHSANEGAQIHPVAPLAPVDLEAYAKGNFGRWDVQPVQDHYVGRFLDLARDRGIAVAWVLPPLLPELRAKFENDEFAESWQSYIDSWLERAPNLFVIDGMQSDYPESAFMDPNHLSIEGATVFSDDVAALLTQPKSSARRRVLPKYRPPSSLVGVEDLGATGREIGRRRALEAVAKQGTTAQGKVTR